MPIYKVSLLLDMERVSGKREMEGVAVFGGRASSGFFVSSLHRPQNGASNGRLSCTTHNLNIRTHNNLSSFTSSSSSSFISHSKLRSKKNKPRIFLPHFVASMEEVQKTYIMIKPDGVQRGLVGEIISRFEKKGFKLTGLKLFQCPKQLAEEHYNELSAKPFFPKLIEYITSGPVVCMAWEGFGVVAAARKIIGATNPLQAEAGTIRGDLAVQTGRNVVHGSDSPDNGKREIALWFKEGEVCQWTSAQEPWIIE